MRNLGIVDISHECAPVWEELVAQNPASGFMQSLHWAEFKRRQGLECLHLGLFCQGKLIGGSIFYAPEKGTGPAILVAPAGPVLPFENEPVAEEGFSLIMKAAEAHATVSGALALRVEPLLPPPGSPVLAEFRRAPVDLLPNETLHLDLTAPVDEILSGMKAKGRYNIRVAERAGVVVREHRSPASVVPFYRVMREAASRDGFALEPLSFFITLVETLQPAGKIKLLFAEHQGDLLGALLLLLIGNRATYLYGGITNSKRNLMAGYALQWAAIQAAKQAGCTSYDFYGFDQFRTPGHRYARFSQFKSQFGGQVKRFIGAHDYFLLDRLADLVIDLLKEAPAAELVPARHTRSIKDTPAPMMLR